MKQIQVPMVTVILLLGTMVSGVAFSGDKPEVLLMEYFNDGGQGSPVRKTLLLYNTGTTLLILDSINRGRDTLYGSLDSDEILELRETFNSNGWSTADTLMFACLACPEFQITYDNKTVRGSTPTAEILNIITSLEEILAQFQPTAAGNGLQGTTKRIPSHSIKRTALNHGIISPGLLVKKHDRNGYFNLKGRSVIAGRGRCQLSKHSE